MGQMITKSRKGKKSKGFDPNRDYLNDAVKDYLERGGRIKKVVDITEDYDQFGTVQDALIPADDFLMGQ